MCLGALSSSVPSAIKDRSLSDTILLLPPKTLTAHTTLANVLTLEAS